MANLIDMDGNEIEHGFDVLLRPRDVAVLVSVDPRTVTKWAKEGKLYAVRLSASGHRRFPEECVRALLRGDKEGASRKPTGTHTVQHVSED